MNGNSTVKVLEALRESILHAKESQLEADDGNRGEGDGAYSVCLAMVTASLETVKAMSPAPRKRRERERQSVNA